MRGDAPPIKDPFVLRFLEKTTPRDTAIDRAKKAYSREALSSSISCSRNASFAAALPHLTYVSARPSI
jgi:hypothetical protein